MREVTKSDVEAALSGIEKALGPLDDTAVAHAFQEGTSLVLGERKVRYIAPVDIQEDLGLKVVLFKRSLTTGWDCPRAEVMMSFRRAVDQTLIAQLVGRMVRTPLARAVSGSEFLNSVCLYLPYYDADALDKTIEYLTEPDPEIGFPTRVQRGDKLITLKRNSATDEAFEAADGLPTYHVEKVAKQSNIRRLLRLGRLLAWDELDKKAAQRFTDALVAVLVKELKKVAETKEFKQRVAEAELINVRGVTVAYGETTKQEVTAGQLTAVSENIEHAFAEAGRKLSGGLHAAYLQARAAKKDAPAVADIKLELYALLDDGEVATRVQQKAGELLAAALDKHKVAIRDLPDERRQQYRQIRRQAGAPDAEPWELPSSIEASKDGTVKLEKHLYVPAAGKFAATLNQWERQVISEAIADEDVIGWLRNDPRKQWSFTVPYRHGNEDRPMYPDFLVFRRSGDGVVCDILEPHSLSFEDSAAKAKGLAEFAKKHGDEFGRIELIAKLGSALKPLRLDDIDTRDKVLTVATNDHLKQLFESA